MTKREATAACKKMLASMDFPHAWVMDVSSIEVDAWGSGRHTKVVEWHYCLRNDYTVVWPSVLSGKYRCLIEGVKAKGHIMWGTSKVYSTSQKAFDMEFKSFRAYLNKLGHIENALLRCRRKMP